MFGSTLLLEEYFTAGDARFLSELRSPRAGTGLKALGVRWQADARPFARQALFEYLRGDIDRPADRPLLKALFKAAEAGGDDELMGHFLVAFDGLKVRRLVSRWNWRDNAVRERLIIGTGLVPRVPGRDRAKDPFKGRGTFSGGAMRFTRATRRYLQRRAWRYFRHLAFRDAARYRKAVCAALALYRDEALVTSVQLLDAWGLLNALYRGSPVLRFAPGGADLAPGESLQKLKPAPFSAESWKDGFEPLLNLAVEARSRPVRRWACQWLTGSSVTPPMNLPMATVRRLLRSGDPDVQALGSAFLARVPDLGSLPISEWLELLELESPDVLVPIVALVKQHVAPTRLSLAQCVALAGARVASVAELGLGWARARPVKSEADLDALLGLLGARVAPVRKAAAEWLAGLLLLNEGPGMPLRVRAMLDASHADVRAPALALMQKDARFGQATLLWAAMAESPWPEVREALVVSLEDKVKAFAPQTLHALWATSLLAIHRGGRAKARVARQVAERLVQAPAEAPQLLPLLSVALRSVRPPERSAALAALTRAATIAPALWAQVHAALPEFTVPQVEAWS